MAKTRVPAVEGLFTMDEGDPHLIAGRAPNGSYFFPKDLGGSDPYSASKACTELVSGAYGRSFFAEGTGLATVRAGNVVGGGDWAEDRLVPDAVRALAAGVPLRVRHPHAVRPWQHVLDALAGYMIVGERLLDGDAAAATA